MFQSNSQIVNQYVFDKIQYEMQFLLSLYFFVLGLSGAKTVQ